MDYPCLVGHARKDFFRRGDCGVKTQKTLLNGKSEIVTIAALVISLEGVAPYRNSATVRNVAKCAVNLSSGSIIYDRKNSASRNCAGIDGAEE